MILQKIIPFPIRVGLRRFLRCMQNITDTKRYAITKTQDISGFGVLLAGRSSRLIKKVSDDLIHLQQNKKKTLEIAIKTMDCTIVNPGECFSFWRLVGNPSQRKGYVKGFELRGGKLVESIAGGICQISNALCWCAINSGLEIIERHRHGYDLFPDDKRDVPFGSGATVLYNFRDFIFRNILDSPVLVRVGVDDKNLNVQFFAKHKPKFTVEVDEREHRFVRKDDIIFRENEIWRRFVMSDGDVREEMVFSNSAVVMYDVDID